MVVDAQGVRVKDKFEGVFWGARGQVLAVMSSNYLVASAGVNKNTEKKHREETPRRNTEKKCMCW